MATQQALYYAILIQQPPETFQLKRIEEMESNSETQPVVLAKDIDSVAL